MEFNIEAIEAFQTELVQIVEQQKKKDDEKYNYQKDIIGNFLIRLQLIKTSDNNSIERVKYLEHEISDTDDSIAIKKTEVKKLNNKLRKYNNTSSRDLLLLKGQKYTVNNNDKIQLAVKLSKLQNINNSNNK